MSAVSTLLPRRTFGCGLALAISLTGFSALAGDPALRLAIKGYDPVSYFTPGKSMPGSVDISYEWDGARWQFANAAHRDLFQSNPEAYAPQYGGYCALGMTTDVRGQIDPEAWAIVNGKLYFTYDRAALAKWRQNPAANIAQADQNWTKLQR